MKKAVKKAIDISLIVLIVLLFIFGAFILTIAVTKKDGVSKVFGVALLDIQTDSMKGEFEAGDMVIIKTVKNAADIKVGDIITFWDMLDVNGDGKDEVALNTHRVTQIIKEEGAGGEVTFRYLTKGDANTEADERAKVFNDIEGKYSFKIANFGHVTRFLMSGWGFFLIIVLPLGAFLGYRIYVLVIVVLKLKKEKAVENGEDPETLKAELERLRAQVNSLSSDLSDSAITSAETNAETNGVDNSLKEDLSDGKK